MCGSQDLTVCVPDYGSCCNSTQQRALENQCVLTGNLVLYDVIVSMFPSSFHVVDTDGSLFFQEHTFFKVSFLTFGKKITKNI